jgi:hypothetical protein
VDVLTRPSRADFSRHLAGIGLPAVVRGALDSWPAASTWSFAFFSELFGRTRVELNTNIINGACNTRVIVPFETFARSVEHGAAHALGDYVVSGPWPALWGLYFTAGIGEMRPFRDRLFADFEPKFPFVPDLLQELGEPFRRLPFCLPFGNLYLGDAGTRALLHPDYWGTHAYIAQLAGRKHALLFPPDDARFLCSGPLRYADPRAPDLEAYPEFHEATAHEAVLEPGDLLFIPSDWLHDVVALTPSISLSWNFPTSENVVGYLRGLVSHPDALTYAHSLGLFPKGAEG